MNVFQHGKYQTMGGLAAIVAQTKVQQRHFVLRGAVKEKEDSNIYLLTAWSLEGKCLAMMSEAFNLIPKQ